jgi:hypothetical protein
MNTEDHQSPTRTPNPIIAYCADCRKSLGDSDIEHQDVLVICPNGKGHIARVVKVPAGIPWLRVERWLLRWELQYSPRCWFDSWKGIFKERAGAYLVARLILLLSLCLVLDISYLTPYHWGIMILSYAVGLFFLADLVVSNTSIAFISHFPANPIRSAIFALFGLITLSTIFALFYLGIPNDFTPCLNLCSANYFSLVTVVTLGYGDIHPRENHELAQIIVSSKSLKGRSFLT